METLTITLERLRDRLVAADPGLLRLRRAALAVGGIGFAIVVLGLLGQPIPLILVAAIAAMQAAFTVNDKAPRAQAVTLLLAFCSGTLSLTVASIGVSMPPVDSVLFVLLIFVAVYLQRFAPRGPALGGLAFFMFFFAMFLQIHLSQLPQFVFALAVGMVGNAVMRFAILRRNPEGELLRIRRAFRARLGRHAAATAAYLAGNGSDRRRTQLRRADSRLHETVMMVEDAINEVLDPPASELLRRRAIEVEIAAQWLSITAQRTDVESLPDEVRDELIGSLLRFESLIEHDPRELPVISDTDEFSRMLVIGSQLKDRLEPGDELRRAVAELALADVHAQRIADEDYSAEAELEEAAPPARKPLFAFDNQGRAALQAMIGGGLAVAGGEFVSHQRWYWAVLTVFVVFLNTSSSGATLVKGFRRVLGTLAGIFGGMLLTLLVTGDLTLTIVLILACVFTVVYVARVSQVLMAFFITCMLGLLYSLLGTFSIDVLWLRVAETAVGAAAGVIAALIVLPVRTRAVLRSDLEAVLDDLRHFLDQAEVLLTGHENVNIIELSRELDRSIEQARATVEPLTHPISVSSRRSYGTYVLTVLDRISFRARLIAARAEPGQFAGDARVTELVDRITHNIDVLAESVRGGRQRRLDRDTETPITRESDDRHARAVLTSLGLLDERVISLGRVFEVPTAESVKPGVGRRTGSAQAEADRVTNTSEENVRRSTQ